MMNFLIFNPALAACEEILTLNTVCSRRLAHVHKKTHHINMNKTFWLYGPPGSIKVMKYTNIKKYLAHHCRKLIPHNCQFSPVHLFALWLNGEDTGNGGLKQSLDGSVTFVFPFMNPGKVCQIEEIYCSQWKLTWCWGRSRSTRWSPSPCRTHTPHSGYLSLLQSLGGAACSGVTTHTHTHQTVSPQRALQWFSIWFRPDWHEYDDVRRLLPCYGSERESSQWWCVRSDSPCTLLPGGAAVQAALLTCLHTPRPIEA